MARKVIVTGRFNPTFPYIDDRGIQRQASTKFAVPDHFDGDVNILAGIMASGGAEVFKVGGTIINDIGNNPCPESSNFTTRRLKFVFEDGSSISVPVADVSNIAATANTILNNIGSATELEVVCIQEIGEEFIDTLAEFEGANFTGAPIAPTNASRYYSGTANYQTSIGNQQLLLPFKILSENAPDAPPGVFTESWAGCVGELQQGNFSCGASSRRFEHRRYIASVVVNANIGGGESQNNTAESHEIPVLGRSSNQVVACGQAIVSERGQNLFCLGYKGNSDNRFHLNSEVQL